MLKVDLRNIQKHLILHLVERNPQNSSIEHQNNQQRERISKLNKSLIQLKLNFKERPRKRHYRRIYSKISAEIDPNHSTLNCSQRRSTPISLKGNIKCTYWQIKLENKFQKAEIQKEIYVLLENLETVIFAFSVVKGYVNPQLYTYHLQSLIKKLKEHYGITVILASQIIIGVRHKSLFANIYPSIKPNRILLNAIFNIKKNQLQSTLHNRIHQFYNSISDAQIEKYLLQCLPNARLQLIDKNKSSGFCNLEQQYESYSYYYSPYLYFNEGGGVDIFETSQIIFSIQKIIHSKLQKEFKEIQMQALCTLYLAKVIHIQEQSNLKQKSNSNEDPLSLKIDSQLDKISFNCIKHFSKVQYVKNE